MSKHLPGPWELMDIGDYGDFDGYSRVLMSEPLSGDNPVRIAAIHTHGDDVSEANASLIAAAPDLYEALRDMCSTGGLDDGTDIIAKAEAALAKARGETPLKGRP